MTQNLFTDQFQKERERMLAYAAKNGVTIKHAQGFWRIYRDDEQIALCTTENYATEIAFALARLKTKIN